MVKMSVEPARIRRRRRDSRAVTPSCCGGGGGPPARGRPHCALTRTQSAALAAAAGSPVPAIRPFGHSRAPGHDPHASQGCPEPPSPGRRVQCREELEMKVSAGKTPTCQTSRLVFSVVSVGFAAPRKMCVGDMLSTLWNLKAQQTQSLG